MFENASEDDVKAVSLIVGICFHCKLPIYQYPPNANDDGDELPVRTDVWFHFSNGYICCHPDKVKETSDCEGKQAQPSNLFWAKTMEITKEMWEELSKAQPRDSIEIAPQEGEELK